jgi:hypothetical protein
VDSSVQPSGVREAIIEDGILDMMICTEDYHTIGSYLDATSYTQSLFWRWIEKSDALVARDVPRRLAMSLWMFKSGREIPQTDALSKLLKKAVINEERPIPIIVLAHVEGETILTVRCPDVPQDAEVPTKMLAMLINFATTILCVKTENLRLCRDRELGQNVSIPAAVQRQLEMIRLSANLPKGDYPGEVLETSSGVKANLVEMLALMRLLNSKSELIRVRPAKKGDPQIKAVTLQDLRVKFNMKMGLESKVESWALRFIKSTLALLIKSNNKQFPGGWTYAAKSRNNTSSMEGLLHQMGYTFVIPPDYNVMSVLMSRTTTDPAGDKKIRPLNEKETLDYSEFRTAVALTLPKISPASTVSMDRQVREDPLDCRRPHVISAFKENKRQKLTNALRTAFAIKTAVESKKASKATGVHFVHTRNELVNLSHGLSFVDATGVEYTRYNEIPEHVRGFLQKRFHHPIGDKSKRPPSPSEMDVEEEQPPAKKAKVSKAVPKEGKKPSARKELPNKGKQPEKMAQKAGPSAKAATPASVGSLTASHDSFLRHTGELPPLEEGISYDWKPVEETDPHFSEVHPGF